VNDGKSSKVFHPRMLALIFLTPDEPNKPVERFKVVDKYKNCTVVRYTDPTNRWHYLLHCGL